MSFDNTHFHHHHHHHHVSNKKYFYVNEFFKKNNVKHSMNKKLQENEKTMLKLNNILLSCCKCIEYGSIYCEYLYNISSPTSSGN